MKVFEQLFQFGSQRNFVYSIISKLNQNIVVIRFNAPFEHGPVTVKRPYSN